MKFEPFENRSFKLIPENDQDISWILMFIKHWGEVAGYKYGLELELIDVDDENIADHLYTYDFKDKDPDDVLIENNWNWEDIKHLTIQPFL